MNIVRVTVAGQLLIFNREPNTVQELKTSEDDMIRIWMSESGTLRVRSLGFYPFEMETKDLIGDISITLSRDLNIVNTGGKTKRRSLWKKKKI